MTFAEWLLWRWDRRRARRACERGGHHVTGPHLAVGGWYVYNCTRCPYRFRADRVLPIASVDDVPEQVPDEPGRGAADD